MKKSIKRLSALLLTLCMLASLMVPVAFADDEAVATPTATVAERYQIRLKDLNVKDATTAKDLDLLMVKKGTYRAFSWDDTDLKVEDAYTAGTLNWKFVSTSGKLSYRVEEMYQLRMQADWAALQIKVADTGRYTLNMTSDKTVDTETEDTAWTNTNAAWAGDVTAYLIPVAVVNEAVANAVVPEDGSLTAQQVAIAGLMTEEYCVGTKSLAAEDDTVSFDKAFLENGEYVVVYTTSVSNYCLCEMTLTKTAEDAARYELTQIENYGIRLVDPSVSPEKAFNDNGPAKQFVIVTPDETSGTSTYAYTTSNIAIKNAGTADYYKNGVLNWKYLGNSTNWSYRPGVQYQVRVDKGGWIAFQIKVPTAGKYALTLSTVDAGTYTADAYVLNVNDKPEGAAYADMVAAEYSIGSAIVTADKSGVFDAKYYDAGEYIVVLSNTGDNFPICAMGLSQYAIDKAPELSSDKLSGTVAEYNFALYEEDRYAPMFNGNLGFSNNTRGELEGVYELGERVSGVIDREYEAGMLNWNFVESTADRCIMEGEDKRGVRIQMEYGTADAPTSGYAAFCLNVPATGLYTVDVEATYNSTDRVDIYVYNAAAEGTVADNMTQDNLVSTVLNSAIATGFVAELKAGENIIVFSLPNAPEKDTYCFKTIELKVLEEAVTYNFDLTTNEAFINVVSEGTQGKVTAIPTNTSMEKYTYTDDAGASKTFYVYSALASLFANGGINWALDAQLNDNAKEAYASIRTNAGNIRSIMKNVDGYLGIRIRVPNAGKYNITVNATGAQNVYFIPATNTYLEYGNRMDVAPYMKEDYLVVDNTYTFEKAGEYVVVLEEVADNDNIYLSSIVMEPVSFNVVGDGVGYASLEAALEAGVENVFLCDHTAVGDILVPAGTTLDLNGYDLNAASLEAAPGAHIIDSTDGNSTIWVGNGITFYEKNAQLPLYDADNNVYYLYNVDVVPVATTGTGDMTKYWFQVKFSNKDALNLIGATTELRIKALLSGTDDANAPLAGEAIADAAFSANWAAKYAKNDGIYITVTALGSEDFANLAMNPAVFANGVTISGDAMCKATA